MVDDEYFLNRAYQAFHHVPSWLWTMGEFWKLSAEQIRYLEELDDAMVDGEIEHGRWLRRQSKEIQHGTFFCETDAEKFAVLSEKLDEAYEDYEKSIKKDEPVITRKLMIFLRDLDGMEKARRGFVAREHHEPGEGNQGIAEADIMRAREYPLERLVDPNKAGYILCPFHSDSKPSMWIKNGFGFCFSCGVHCDSIKWLVEVKKMKFQEAVRWLCGN